MLTETSSLCHSKVQILLLLGIGSRILKVQRAAGLTAGQPCLDP